MLKDCTFFTVTPSIRHDEIRTSNYDIWRVVFSRSIPALAPKDPTTTNTACSPELIRCCHCVCDSLCCCLLLAGCLPTIFDRLSWHAQTLDLLLPCCSQHSSSSCIFAWHCIHDHSEEVGVSRGHPEVPAGSFARCAVSAPVRWGVYSHDRYYRIKNQILNKCCMYRW